MYVCVSGVIYLLLDLQLKSEVEIGFEMYKVVELVVISFIGNQFVVGLIGSNRGDVNLVDFGVVAEGESEF